jgi:glutamyl-tRNA reductase
LFEEEISIPVSTPEEVSGPVRRTTRSMAKKVTIPHVPSFPEDPVDIPTSPEQEDMYVTTISETEELVTETLKDLRREVEAREEITEKETLEPISSLTKHQLVLKVERLTKQNEELKQEVEEYKVLDRHIKKENAQLKENNRRLQDEHDEVSAKLNKVMCLIQYT